MCTIIFWFDIYFQINKFGFFFAHFFRPDLFDVFYDVSFIDFFSKPLYIYFCI